MGLKFVINPEAVQGEAIRLHLTRKGYSARDLAEHLGIHEGNVSYMLSRGQQFRKHGEKVLQFIGLSKKELEAEKLRVMSILTKNGVELIEGWKHEDPLLVLVPYQAVQKLIG